MWRLLFTFLFGCSDLVARLATAQPQAPVNSPTPDPKALLVTEVPPQKVETTGGRLDDVSLDSMPAEGDPCIDGQRIDRDCQEVCICIKERFNCKQRCALPLMISSVTPPDGCQLNPTPDRCCSSLICLHMGTNTTEPVNNTCLYKGKQYEVGESFNDSCDLSCNCTLNGETKCFPRCPPMNQTANTDRCVSVQDPKDPCCSVLYCDVNETENDGLEDHNTDIIIKNAIAFNSTAIELKLLYSLEFDNLSAETSVDKVNWDTTEVHNNLVTGLKEGTTYFIRLILGDIKSNIVSVELPKRTNNTSCVHKGVTRSVGEEFFDNCTAYCICSKSGIECSLIKCPTDFGLDVFDPNCLEWETIPSNFTPVPPKCCPETVQCKRNGSCIYKNQSFHNWADIPEALTGCEKRCYCEEGNVTCHPRCPPVPAAPPHDLNCSPSSAILSNQNDDDCCLYWVCPPSESDGITVHNLEAIDEHTVKLVFSVPPVLVGLHGRVELRYTADNKNSDPSTWEQKVLAPPNDFIATQELEFELDGLKPATEYKIKITVVMRDLQNSPASQILLVKTPPAAGPTTVLPAFIPVEPELRVNNINSSKAELSWRKFSDFEYQFIDGVQLRYKEIHGKVYQATPLIHRAVTSYTLEDLKPDSQYEVNIFFIPFPGQTTELQAHNGIQFSTELENDPYKFDLVVDVRSIKTTSIEVSWGGVPYPEDKFVNIYRIIYQADSGREEKNDFKVAKRDSSSGAFIQSLKPNTRYRLWLEAYLTNGKIKKSNVQDFTTKQYVVTPEDLNQGMLEGTPINEESSYYGALIGVSVLATIAIIAAIGLLVILARKHGHNKAPITAVNRKPITQHTAAYDNPSYKTCENDITNSGRIEIPLEETG